MLTKDLLKDLKSQNLRTKKEAARRLGELKDREAVEGLIAALDTGGDALQDIIWALGRIGDPRATNPLIPYLKDENWHLRAQAAESLGLIGVGEEIVDVLIKTLEDENDTVFWKAAWALAEIGDPQASDPLLARVGNPESPRCWQAAWILGKMGEKRAVGSILTLLEHQDILIRRHALMALQMLKEPSATEAIILRLSDSDWENRNYASEALISIGHPAVPLLEKNREQADPDTRSKIDWILDNIKENG